MEISEAVDYIKSHLEGCKKWGIEVSRHNKALQTLISLAERVESSEWPEKRTEPKNYYSPTEYWTAQRIEGFNQAIDLCRLAAVKGQMTLEELGRIVDESAGFQMGKNNRFMIAQAIHTAQAEKMKGGIK
jgi:hypothetical protein